MVQFIQPPNHPFCSPRPPPALLPLLSPILRQRVQLLSTTSSTSDSWLPLLCWNEALGTRLSEIIENSNFEPHPVSGEVELKDPDQILYRRVDEETLQAKLDLEDSSLTAIYIWCPNDDEHGSNGWRLSELRPFEAENPRDQTWYSSISAANDHPGSSEAVSPLERPTAQSQIASNGGSAPPEQRDARNDDEDDDDAYWRQYDNASSQQTPAKSRSPAPPTTRRDTKGRRDPAISSMSAEQKYYAQYESVQPALDPDEPSSVSPSEARNAKQPTKFPPTAFEPQPLTSTPPVKNPRRLSSSPPSSPVQRMEASAVTQSAAEAGIKTHVSASLKSLFRLARAAGIERVEFERLVSRELEVLNFLDGEDEGAVA
ncbi:MAG: hypothetical protein M1833_004408 [Piccolia ochrophora]|nr:MAG: hypothetical protein M1833_004408 [Piccolia ochrophora]